MRAVLIPESVKELEEVFTNNESVELVICEGVIRTLGLTFGNCSNLRQVVLGKNVQDNVEAPDIDYILVPIKFDHIKKLEITFNPWMEQHTTEEIKQFVYSISGFSKGQICFQNSILTGEIGEFTIIKKSYLET